MSIVESFIQRYEREYDFYDKVCRKAESLLDDLLSDAGIRAIVTSRAKSPTRLRDKLNQRNVSKKYKNEIDIYNDIADLAGLRIALYFPDSNFEVDRIIKEAFCLIEEEKKFPKEGAIRKTGNRINRFPGYVATHYRVTLKNNDGQKTIYHDAPIEIQVASVLMHAWSEVEHDLVYKPLSGDLSDEEYAILDEINGLVLSGEIALERLKHAGVMRSSKGNKPYSNQYELAASIIDIHGDLSRGDEASSHNLSNIGRVNVLLDILKTSNNNTPEKLRKIIEKVKGESSSDVPFAEKIISYVLDENPSLFPDLNKISDNVSDGKRYKNVSSSIQEGYYRDNFFKMYAELYELITNLARDKGKDPKNGVFRLTEVLPPPLLADYSRVRDVRNRIAHAKSVPLGEIIVTMRIIEEMKTELEQMMNK